jgi:hypothetical protein
VNAARSSSPYRESIFRCRERADQCRLDAEGARTGPDEEAWLDLAEDWDKLAEAFELVDGPKWLQ